jgi:hypothetical protein
MKSNQQRKISEPEAKQNPPKAERPIWFMIQDQKSKPAQEKTEDPIIEDKEQSEETPEVVARPEERRPSQLEAYMRYAKMREPHEDEQLAPIRARRFQPPENFAHNESETSWIEKASPRRRRRKAAYDFRIRDAVFAGIASIAIGALGGAVVYDRANDGQLTSAAFDQIGSFMTGFGMQDGNVVDVAPKPAGASDQTELNPAAQSRKPIATARLDVSDATGNVNTLIPLQISAEPALPSQDIALRLSGLPADAYLTAGTKLADNAWILKPGEELGVKLMVPSAQTSPLLIAVDAIEPRTGDLAAPTEEIKVALGNATPAATGVPAGLTASQVEPVSAPPTDVKRNFNLPPAGQHETAAAQPIPAPLEKAAVTGDSDSLMRNGDKLLNLGDFSAARAFFSKARDLGNREASLRLGQTYDPVVFRDKNVQGLKPDPAMALKYYLEARTAGVEDADTAITGLESWLKQ